MGGGGGEGEEKGCRGVRGVGRGGRGGGGRHNESQLVLVWLHPNTLIMILCAKCGWTAYPGYGVVTGGERVGRGKHDSGTASKAGSADSNTHTHTHSDTHAPSSALCPANTLTPAGPHLAVLSS